MLLGRFALVAMALLVATMLTDGDVAKWRVVSIGPFNSIMFPTIFALGIERHGPLTGKASSLLVMAIVGGASVPLAMGGGADNHGLPRFAVGLDGDYVCGWVIVRRER